MKGPLVWLRRRALALDDATAKKPLLELVDAHSPRLPALERIVEAFVAGYNAALAEPELTQLAATLDEIDARRRGFAYEGAGMALWMLDSLSPLRGDRWHRFEARVAAPHTFLLHVGAGWAIARMHRNWRERTQSLDPLLRWLALDGYGFHEGFFHAQRFHREHARPELDDAHAHCIFDTGLGRSMWFVEGADVERIRNAVADFAQERRPALWSGVGLACAYAGGVTHDELDVLLDACGKDLAEFAQGVAFAAAARERAHNAVEHTQQTCERVWGRGPEEVALIVERARAAPLMAAGEPAYLNWRRGVRQAFEHNEVKRAAMG